MVQHRKTFSVSVSKYRVDGLPGELELSSYGPTSNPEVVGNFRSGYLWDQFERAHVTLANEVANQSECLVIRGTVSDPPDLNYLRNFIGIITWCLDSGGVAVFDTDV